MDPDANIEEQLRIVASLTKNFDGRTMSGDQLSADVIRLCDLVDSLDEWIVNGGFLPARWRGK